MSNIALTQPHELIAFDDQKLQLIRTTVARDLVPLEFDLFMAVAKARGLDPILKQIHAVKRDGKMTVQVGIDGFRLIAARTGEYAGCDEPQFQYDDKGPVRCKFTVYRFVKGVRCSFTATARWEEYCPAGNMAFMWNKMPETMLSKVCEALALRKAFPADLSGLYVDEEMHQADTVSTTSRDVSPAKTESKTQKEESPKELQKSAGEFKITFGKKFNGLTIAQAVERDGLPIVQKYVAWLEGESEKQGRPLMGDAQYLKVNLQRYENELKSNHEEASDDWQRDSFDSDLDVALAKNGGK